MLARVPSLTSRSRAPQSLLRVHAATLRGRPIILAGESFAGTYIPSIASCVVSRFSRARARALPLSAARRLSRLTSVARALPRRYVLALEAQRAADAAGARDAFRANGDAPLPIQALALGNPWLAPTTQVRRTRRATTGRAASRNVAERAPGNASPRAP